MKTREKVMFTIVLAIIWVGLMAWLDSAPDKRATDGRCEALKVWYDGYNEAYFGNSLPKDTVIDYTGTGEYAALTRRMEDGTFHIVFNAKYTASPIFSHLILLHESCHIKTWDEFDEHGPRWVACMETLELNGAFHREIILQFSERPEGTGSRSVPRHIK